MKIDHSVHVVHICLKRIGYKLFKETNGSLEAINGLPFNLLKETINEHL